MRLESQGGRIYNVVVGREEGLGSLRLCEFDFLHSHASTRPKQVKEHRIWNTILAQEGPNNTKIFSRAKTARSCVVHGPHQYHRTEFRTAVMYAARVQAMCLARGVQGRTAVGSIYQEVERSR
jgi:hypothetical protein